MIDKMLRKLLILGILIGITLLIFSMIFISVVLILTIFVSGSYLLGNLTGINGEYIFYSIFFFGFLIIAICIWILFKKNISDYANKIISVVNLK